MTKLSCRVNFKPDSVCRKEQREAQIQTQIHGHATTAAPTLPKAKATATPSMTMAMAMPAAHVLPSVHHATNENKV